MSESFPAAECEVAVVGGGFAGTSAAVVLARQGFSVALLERNPLPQPALRVEKLSGDQMAMLETLGLLEPFKGATTLVASAINIRGKVVIDQTHVDEHALPYADMLKLLRQQLPPQVRQVFGRVSAIDNSADRQTVHLADGRQISARLVVLATGQARGLVESLGIERQVVNRTPTVSIAFTLRPGPREIAFSSLAAYGEKAADGVDYSCIFPSGPDLRVNVFLFGSPTDRRITAFRTDPMGALFALQPGLVPWLEGCRAIDRAAFFVSELAICVQAERHGVVLIGDAFRTSCPGVGDGLSCLLRDVACLSTCVGEWLEAPGMEAGKIARFYADPVKRAQDVATHRRALQRRRAMLTDTALNRFRRELHFARRRCGALLKR